MSACPIHSSACSRCISLAANPSPCPFQRWGSDGEDDDHHRSRSTTNNLRGSPDASDTDAERPSFSASPFLDRCKDALSVKYGTGVEVSDDAGRFVCNYTLATTLRRLKEQKIANVSAMFLHVPIFDYIPLEIA